jgi:hypothetical protein
MNRHKILDIALGFMVILAFYAGLRLGTSQERWVYENMNFLVVSNRNLETALNITALEGLRENRIEEMIRFLEVRVQAGLRYDEMETKTLARAREYQNKYCKTLCLGIQR